MLKIWFVYIGLSITLPSCIIGHSVSIINDTEAEQSIRVLYPAHFTAKILDTLKGYDIRTTANALSSRDYYRYPVKIPIENLDTIKRTYAFRLHAGHRIVLESVYPNISPGFGQVFIINETDTVSFVKKGNHFKKHPKLGKGGSWIFRIKDE